MAYKAWLLILYSIAALTAVVSGHLEIYEGANFTGLILDTSESPDTCKSLPEGTSGASLKTNDCIHLNQGDCTSDTFSVQVPPGEYSQGDLTALVEGTGWAFNNFKSYQRCENSTAVDVTLFDFPADSVPIPPRDQLIKYEGLCGCVSLPGLAASKVRKIYVRGTCVQVFKNPGCEGPEFLKLRGGRTPAHDDLKSVDYDGVISLSSCNETPLCMTFEVTINKFVLTSPLPNLIVVPLNDDELGSGTMNWNNGSVSVTQLYESTKDFDETVTVTLLSKPNNVTIHVPDHVRIETSSNLPHFAKATLVSALRDGYLTSAVGETEFGLRKARPFHVSQTVTIPACTVYEIESFVSAVQDYEVNYFVTAKVTGTKPNHGDAPMTAAELRMFFRYPGFTVKEDNGSDGIVVEGGSKLVATLGVEAVTNEKQSLILSCVYVVTDGAEWRTSAIVPVVALGVFSVVFFR